MTAKLIVIYDIIALCFVKSLNYISRADIISRYQSVFATDNLPIVGHFSLVADFDFLRQLDSLLKEPSDDGRVTVKNAHYYLTDKGRRTLNRKLV